MVPKNTSLQVRDGVGRLGIDGQGSPRKGLYEQLHGVWWCIFVLCVCVCFVLGRASNASLKHLLVSLSKIIPEQPFGRDVPKHGGG